MYNKIYPFKVYKEFFANVYNCATKITITIENISVIPKGSVVPFSQPIPTPALHNHWFVFSN